MDWPIFVIIRSISCSEIDFCTILNVIPRRKKGIKSHTHFTIDNRVSRTIDLASEETIIKKTTFPFRHKENSFFDILAAVVHWFVTLQKVFLSLQNSDKIPFKEVWKTVFCCDINCVITSFLLLHHKVIFCLFELRYIWFRPFWSISGPMDMHYVKKKVRK